MQRLLRTIEPEAIFRLLTNVHKTLGHVGDEILFKTIDTMDGLEHLRNLVLMKQTGACTGCLLYKGKVIGQPKGEVPRLEEAGRLERMDIHLSGQQKIKSAGHNFNNFVVGVSPQ